MTSAARTFRRLAELAVVLAAMTFASAVGHAQTAPFPFTPWMPTDVYAAPQGDASVTFLSPQDGSANLSIPGVLFKPAGAPKGAVVLVNSSGGWTDAREGHYGRSLSSAGYAVLAIDTYGPRGVPSTLADNTKLTTQAQMRDAFAARKYLISIGYAADRMAIMGTGRGGTIALLAADQTFMQNEKARFALAMAISAGCVFHPRDPKPSAQVFIAVGGQDEIMGVLPCQKLAKEYAEAGGKVTVKVYPGASSRFDGHPGLVAMTRDLVTETFALCNVVVESDGRSSYNDKTFPESDSSALFVEMRKTCIRRGGSGWTNLTQKANVTIDLIAFLDANFRH